MNMKKLLMDSLVLAAISGGGFVFTKHERKGAVLCKNIPDGVNLEESRGAPG